jgi:hypothetical protein
MGELKKVFRPEFLNRIDDVIVFHKLQKPEIKQIVELLLRRVRSASTSAWPRSTIRGWPLLQDQPRHASSVVSRLRARAPPRGSPRHVRTRER